MYIQEIIIDGFKSYATRTVLNGFDPSFNAITGLNGSGKSNIFDAICFVLGITNLSAVRATNMQDLVFKRGQAGVSKASVTITFDNRDKTRSPQGYENYNEITVARIINISKSNKYLLNGKTATVQAVQKMFHSVQLNVNNPHFLIMQGRITKVLNMKPEEILGLIAEAAGTNMFEMQKKSAEKTFEKKDKKLIDIDDVLNKNIIPTMNKLRKEQEKFIEYTRGKEKCEHLERYVTAFQYFTKKKQLTPLQQDLEAVEKDIEQLQSTLTDHKQEFRKLEIEVEEKRKERHDGVESSYSKMDKRVAELSKVLVQKNSEYEHLSEQYKSECDRAKGMKAQIEADKQELGDTRIQANSCKDVVESLRELADQWQRKLENYKKQRSDVLAGLAVSNDNQDGQTLTEQLIALKRKASKLETEEEQAKLRIRHLNNTIAEKETALEKLHDLEQHLHSRLDTEEREMISMKQKLSGMGFDNEKYKNLRSQHDDIQQKVKDIDQEIVDMTHEITYFFFDFDRSLFRDESVKGTVAQLFSMYDPEKSSIALEVTAGNKLLQIVVDNEETAKKLISGRKQSRITVIPLNKIRTNMLSDDVIERAKKMNAKPALFLIEYERDVDPAMKYVFGNTLVCKGFEDAKRVAFDEHIRKRTVTLAGDSFDPSGTLTGGSRPKGKDSPLLKLSILRKKQQEREQLIVSHTEVQRALELLDTEYKQVREVRKTISLKEHEIELLKQRIQSGRYAQQKQQVEDMKVEIAALQQKLPILGEQRNLNEQTLQQVEQHISNFSSNEQTKESQIKTIDKNIEDAKRQAKTAQKKLQDKEDECRRLEAQIQEQEKDLSDLERQLKDLEEQVSDMQKKELENFEVEVLSLKKKYDKLSKKLGDLQQQMSQKDGELSRLVDKRDRIEQRISELNLEIKKAQHKKTRLQSTEKEVTNSLKNILAQHSWIKAEEHLFGRANTEYHFDESRGSLQDVQVELAQLKTSQQKLSQSVNKKVMSLYENSEKEFKRLQEKRTILTKDKSKIQQVMHDLDEKKHIKLHQTWEKVNSDFSEIFSTLLPGATCKLEPEYSDTNEDTLQGLEVRVAFGEVWKESLSELSGGQRSLLALSLILALLRFSPAPMYILDEIDAALDPSHTQNIGRILRTHFANSQFLIISLKEGMFQNANVLFKTKFIDGKSTVTREANHKSVINDEDVVVGAKKRTSSSLIDEGDEDSPPPAKRRRRVT